MLDTYDCMYYVYVVILKGLFNILSLIINHLITTYIKLTK